MKRVAIVVQSVWDTLDFQSNGTRHDCAMFEKKREEEERKNYTTLVSNASGSSKGRKEIKLSRAENTTHNQNILRTLLPHRNARE